MNGRKMLCLTALLICCAGITSRAQSRWQIVEDLERTIEVKEKGWQHIRGVCTSPPLIPGQKSVVISGWERVGESHKEERVNIDIYEVASFVEAAEWMNRYGKGEITRGAEVSRYELGEEAYLTRYQDGLRCEITFMKGEMVIQVRGKSVADVDRFAKYVAEEVSAR